MSRVRRGPTWANEGPRPAQTWDRVATGLIESRETPRDGRAKPSLEPRRDTPAYALARFDWAREGI